MESNILSDLIITNIVSATTIYTEAEAKSKKRDRPAWALSLKYEGETEYTCGNRKLLSNASEVVLLPRGSDYEWVCTDPGHCTIIDFECNGMAKGIYTFHVKDTEKILRKFREVEYKMTLRPPMFLQESLRCIYDIVLTLSGERAATYTPSVKTAKIQPALDYIAKNYSLKITNDELARLCGLSTVYFRKLFAEIYATSPINYIHKLRISKAKEMLASDFASISSIALSLGYINIYDFSRDFKKHTGISPSQYKKNI